MRSARAVFQKLAECGGLRLRGLAGHEPVELFDIGANQFGLAMITAIARLGQAEGIRVEPARFRQPALLQDDGGEIVLEVGEERAVVVGVGLDDGDRLSIVPRGVGQRAAEILEQREVVERLGGVDVVFAELKPGAVDGATGDDDGRFEITGAVFRCKIWSFSSFILPASIKWVF